MVDSGTLGQGWYTLLRLNTGKPQCTGMKIISELHFSLKGTMNTIVCIMKYYAQVSSMGLLHHGHDLFMIFTIRHRHDLFSRFFKSSGTVWVVLSLLTKTTGNFNISKDIKLSSFCHLHSGSKWDQNKISRWVENWLLLPRTRFDSSNIFLSSRFNNFWR